MKKTLIAALLLTLGSGLAYADRLDDAKAAGKLTVGVFDSNPPFGFIDEQSKAIAGYDVDFANELGKKLGFKIELKATNPANRIPLIESDKVDVVVAAFTITEERAKKLEFSYPYFVTGQQFLVPKGKFQKKEDLSTAKIGAVKGTTGEQQVREVFPKATLISYDDISLAYAAQHNGNVQAITQDGAILAGLLASAKDRASYEIPAYRLSDESYGIAVKKGETRLIQEVNKALLDLEKSGVAAKIYDKWFGKNSKTPLPRDFKIVAK